MEKQEVITHDDPVDEKRVVEHKTISGTEAFTEAMIKEPPNPTSWRALVLYGCCIIGFFCSTANGYDTSLINNLLMTDNFKDWFDVQNDGIWTGIVTSMYQIGSVAAIPFVGPAIDTLGRRGGMFTGALIIIIGTVVQGLTVARANIGQFMGGRLLLGFGVSLVASAGPMYVVEVSHPAYRGLATAFYNTFWLVGSIIAAGIARGTTNLSGNLTWSILVWLQLLFSGLICMFIWFLPESPRWLYTRNKHEECKKVLTTYHGEGNPNSVWVELQLREYEEYLEMDGSDKRWWDYRALFRDRASMYRLGCNVMISIYGQWAGNSVLSYFQDKVLETSGYTDEIQKKNINVGINCAQFALSLVGASLVDRLGRRFLLVGANLGCALIWMCLTISTSQYAKTESQSSAQASLAFIYIFSMVYSVGWTPLQALYPVEVLSFEMRAKGMAFSNFAVSAATLINQFAWPEALKDIGWKTYICFTLWDMIQAITVYYIVPETRNRTLEELDDIFHAKNPRKTSTRKKEIGIDQAGTVVEVAAA